jgi:glycosyltransferase involved in cell wall biosynthesis
VLAEQPPDVVLLTHLLHHSPGYVEQAHRWGIPVVLELHDFFLACPRAHLQRTSGERCDGPAGGLACAEHCFPDDRPERAAVRWSLRAAMFRDALRQADAVVCPSRFVADYFAPMRSAASPIEVIDNGVPETFARRHQRSPSDPAAPLHLASIGVATPHKGFHVAIEALRLARLPRVRYTIFGATTPGYDAELREAASAVDGLELRLFGRFEPALLPTLLADVDAVIVPSLVVETYSIAAREALACGVPIFASRIGALATAIQDGVGGRLFTPGDPSELAALLQHVHERRDVLQALAKSIPRDAFVTVDERTARLEQVLLDVVAKGAAPAVEDPSLHVLRDALATALR